MSDRNSTPQDRSRNNERYSELSDLLGDSGGSVGVPPLDAGFNLEKSTSLESAFANVDANYLVRPREVTISGSTASQSWPAAPGAFSRAMPVAVPLAPVALDAWDLRPAINPNSPAKTEPFFHQFEGYVAPTLSIPQPEISDDDIFQSVLEGLEEDILGDSDIATTAQHAFETEKEVERIQPGQSFYAEPVAQNYGTQTADVTVAPPFDPDLDFDATFDDAFFEELPGEPAQEVFAAREFNPAQSENATPQQSIQHKVLPFAEPEFEDLDHQIANDDQRAIMYAESIAPAPNSHTAALTDASTLPRFNAGTNPLFPHSISPYDDVPATGSLNVPDFAVAEVIAPQTASGFDDYEMDDFQPARGVNQVDPFQSDQHEIVVHNSARNGNAPGQFKELADLDFGDAFERDFNPTDELANIVGSNFEDDPLFKPSEDDGFAPMPPMPPISAPRSGRGKYYAFGALGVALVGALAVFYSMGESINASQAPAIVRADNEPVRVAPDNPGGTVVPNQDRVVFNEVGGSAIVLEKPQETLVDGRQQPTIAANPTKENERVLVGDQSAETSTESGPAIAPRSVQTVTVRPDGTLVMTPPPEQPAAVLPPEAVPVVQPETPVIAQAPQIEAAPVAPAAETALVEKPVEAVAAAQAVAKPSKTIASKVPARVVELKPVTQKPKVQPAKAPALDVVPSRPSDQPVNIVNGDAPAVQEQPAGQQIAAAEPAAADALAAGAYAIQIASTPSEEAATSTLRSLSGKFGSVLGGKDYAIQRAEVPGKGTVYRVRILAGSKAEAAKLCSRYKSAGGSCFVTR